MFFAPSKSRWKAEIWIIGISKTSDHIQIKIKMSNPSHDPPMSSKAPNASGISDSYISDLFVKGKCRERTSQLFETECNNVCYATKIEACKYVVYYIGKKIELTLSLTGGGGANRPPLLENAIYSNFSWLSDYIIDLLFK